MIRFSANLGFLWKELSLPKAIEAAKRAGFDAVECHWPYDQDVEDVKAALAVNHLPMLGLNTRRGDISKGENGLAALSGREIEARVLIDEAISYAAAIGCPNIHVMAGFSDQGDLAEACFRRNLTYATKRAAEHHQTILIEPLNHYDAPGYHLTTIDGAIKTIDSVGADNLKIMFDVYHIQIMQGDLIRRLLSTLPYIGHIQIASVPDRAEPDIGELAYPEILRAIDGMNWAGYIGAEYKPKDSTDAGLSWLKRFKAL